jgi:hypothetical protein
MPPSFASFAGATTRAPFTSRRIGATYRSPCAKTTLHAPSAVRPISKFRFAAVFSFLRCRFARASRLLRFGAGASVGPSLLAMLSAPSGQPLLSESCPATAPSQQKGEEEVLAIKAKAEVEVVSCPNRTILDKYTHIHGATC